MKFWLKLKVYCIQNIFCSLFKLFFITTKSVLHINIRKMRFFLIFLYCIHFNVCHANKAKLTDSQHTMFFRCPSFIFSLPTNLQTNALRIGKYCCCWWWWGLDNEGDIFICAFFCCCSWWRWMCHEPVRPLWFIEQYQSSSNINITTWSCVGWLTGWLDGWQKVKQPQPNPRSVFRSYSCVTNCICHIGFLLEHMGGLCSVFYYLLYIYFLVLFLLLVGLTLM